tara:strand:- start:163 stop:426 length:264 start_codon:yes stop_codon:yes gene_type:complete
MKRDKENELYRELNGLYYSMAVKNLKFSIDNMIGIIEVWDKEVLPKMQSDLKKLEKVLEIINDDYYDWENQSVDDVMDSIHAMEWDN